MIVKKKTKKKTSSELKAEFHGYDLKLHISWECSGKQDGPTLLPGLSDDVGGALAHHLGDVKRAVGLIGHSHWAVHSLGLHLQKRRKRRGGIVSFLFTITERYWSFAVVLFFLCHWGRQMTQVLHSFITLISVLLWESKKTPPDWQENHRKSALTSSGWLSTCPSGPVMPCSKILRCS